MKQESFNAIQDKMNAAKSAYHEDDFEVAKKLYEEVLNNFREIKPEELRSIAENVLFKRISK